MFGKFPGEIVSFVRSSFAKANNFVSFAMTSQPNSYEETLDHHFISQLSATAPTFFGSCRAAVSIETHFLGRRAMFGGWEIADIALFVIVSEMGKQISKKVALLQSKRLYPENLPSAELEYEDFAIGIGRIVDKDGPIFPLTTKRPYSFSTKSVYGALRSGDNQIRKIKSYQDEKKLPVYYSLYNPIRLPYKGRLPEDAGKVIRGPNALGMRVQSSDVVHGKLAAMPLGKTPSYGELSKFGGPKYSGSGWRIEDFVADEVLGCREGALFTGERDENLRSLLYERSAPIMAAIAVSIDFEEADESRRP
ncbi:MAG: hypothetical protein ACU0B1_09580 [Thermohalobaculum sp.]